MIFFQIRLSPDHVHITIYLSSIAKPDCLCFPNSMLSRVTLSYKLEKGIKPINFAPVHEAPHVTIVCAVCAL